MDDVAADSRLLSSIAREAGSVWAASTASGASSRPSPATREWRLLVSLPKLRPAKEQTRSKGALSSPRPSEEAAMQSSVRPGICYNRPSRSGARLEPTRASEHRFVEEFV